jgi:formylglycine-generating enzyme required for sulfatase activity
MNYWILRSGSWYADPASCRVPSRYYDEPVNRFDYLGFRLIKTIKK